MKYKLFLDDFRNPRDAFYYTKEKRYNDTDWVVVRNYKEFVNYVTQMSKQKYWPSLVSFDHDLSAEHYDTENQEFGSLREYYAKQGREETGYDCAKWFLEFASKNSLPVPEILCHSMNPASKVNILSLFK